MKIVKLRSPFLIEVNETGAIGSKIDILIWQYGGSSSSPIKTYTLSKSNPSTTQLSTVYNVSNYVKEYIENITNNDDPGINLTSNNDWVFFQVKRYKLVGTTYTLLDTTDYVGINGFTNYSNGRQNGTTTNLSLLANNALKYYYPNSTFDISSAWQGREYLGCLNFIAEKTNVQTLSVTFTNLENTYYNTINLQNGIAGTFNYTIPITYVVNDGEYFKNGCKITIALTGSTSIILYAYPTDECKYTAVKCDYINIYGGWQTLWFFKAQSNSINVKSTDYKLTQNALNYNIPIGQFKSFNTNGRQTIKLNTGWVDENYSEVITDLLLSETVLLDNKPVTVKTQSSDLKTYLKDRNINYEIEFEYAYNLINDVL